MNSFSRSEILLGKGSTDILKNKKVAIFGLGGVGSFVAESLARSFVGSFLLVDFDVVDESNLNRQLIALRSTLGRKKTEVMKERISEINPDAHIECLETFVLPENITSFSLKNCDFVVDAIDTVSAKIALAKFCFENGINIISAMGAGNKLSPLNFHITDIYSTKVCPLAKVMRKELKSLGVANLTVCYSDEEVTGNREPQENTPTSSRRPTTGSLPYVPSVSGLYIGYHVVKVLLGNSYPKGNFEG